MYQGSESQQILPPIINSNDGKFLSEDGDAGESPTPFVKRSDSGGSQRDEVNSEVEISENVEYQAPEEEFHTKFLQGSDFIE